MSDLPPLPDDELVSAYLDGEASPDERAVVEGRPDLLERVERQRQVARQVAATEAPAPAAREATIAAALGAFDATPDATADATPDATAHQPTTGPTSPGDVADLTEARRRRRHRRVLAGLGAAAAVVLVVAIGAAVLRSRSASEVTSIATAAAPVGSTTTVVPAGRPNAAADEAGAGSGTSARANADAAAPSAASGEQPPFSQYEANAGSFADVAALGAALRSRAQSASSTTTGAPTPLIAPPTVPQPITSCLPRLPVDDTRSQPPSQSGQATVAGQAVYFAVFADPSTTGTTRLVVFAPDCRIVGTLDL